MTPGTGHSEATEGRLSLHRFRHRLASFDALPQLAVLGIVSGLVTGAVILLFRWLIEWPAHFWMPGGDVERFEALPELWRFLLPCLGALLIGLILWRTDPKYRKAGIPHVIERLNYHQGYLSLKNTAIQFISAALAIVSGLSTGREGPAVHLGAGSSSSLGQWLQLPNNSIRTLVGCGTAAAISASFNTPMAGVIFAMEVVMMEYTIIGFIPIILASVTGAVVTRLMYGDAPAFSVPSFEMKSLWDLPFTVLMGLVIGTLAALMIFLVRYCQRFNQRSILLKALFIGLLTGLVAQVVPGIMGIGYDTVTAALNGETALVLLCVLALTKLVMTALTSGLGIPIGIVGPTLVIGACAGGAMGIVGAMLLPEAASSSGLYAMLGMGAMMGAVLQAPLAALMTLLELTQNPNIIMPGMLIIVVACLTASELFRQRSLIVSVLQAQGVDPHQQPLAQALSRIGVASVMERRFTRQPRHISLTQAQSLLTQELRWIVVEEEQRTPVLLPAADLARYLYQEEAAEQQGIEPLPEHVDLLAIPAHRLDLADIHLQATLQEALDQLNAHSVDALYVQRMTAPGIRPIQGIVTRAAIEQFYLYRK